MPALSPVDTGGRPLTAAHVMSAPVITVSLDDTLWTAWGLIHRGGFRHLVVVEGLRCVGVLDDQRIASAWPLGPISIGRTRVRDILPARVRCVNADAPVPELARVMLDEGIDAVPVTDARDEVVGLVTVSDLLAVLAFQADRVRER
jgi:CBS domain-containing protein